MLENAGRRSPRDWIVDIAMFILAAGIGTYILVETWRDHDGVEVLLDFVLGAAAWLALWFRRSRPTESPCSPWRPPRSRRWLRAQA